MRPEACAQMTGVVVAEALLEGIRALTACTTIGETITTLFRVVVPCLAGDATLVRGTHVVAATDELTALAVWTRERFLTEHATRTAAPYVVESAPCGHVLALPLRGRGKAMTLLVTQLHADPAVRPSLESLAEVARRVLDQIDVDEADQPRSSEVLRGFFDAPGIYMCVIDVVPDGSDFVFTLPNRYVAAFWNRTPAQMTGMTARQLGYSDDQIAMWVRRFRECEQRGEPMSLEYSTNRPDGTVTWQYAALQAVSLRPGTRSVCLVATDITSHKQAERALLDQAERLRAVIEATNDIIWEWDLASDQITLSEAARALLESEMPARPVPANWLRERVHPEDRARVEASLRGVIDAGESRWHAEYRLLRAGGGYAVILDRGAVIRDGARPIRLVGAMVDVSAMRDSEAALTSRTAELRAIIDAFPDLYFWVNGEGRILDFHTQKPEELAIDPREFLGRRARELFPGPQGEQFEGAIRQALSTQKLHAIEYSLPFAHGLQWFEARYVPVGRDRVIAIIRNITERRAAEEAARHIDEQYRLVTDGVPVLISFVDREQRYRFVNRAYEVMFGAPRETLIGRTIPDLHDLASYNNIRPHIDRVLRGEPVAFENTITLPSGRKRDVTVSYVPHRDAAGAVQGFFALITDVTEQRALEHQLRHAQKMEAIGRLAGGIAHDFNNILTVIGTATELARTAARTGADPASELRHVADATKRAASLTRQLLTFSRKDAPRPQHLDVDEVVRQTEKMLHRMIGEDVILELELASGGATVLADPGHLEQVIMNLAVNARDAMPGGGHLTLRTRRRPPGSGDRGVAAGDHVELTIEDTGIGIDEAIRDRIFEPFFTTKPADRGTGLGLATVYGIVAQCRGEITFTSELGRGTAFRVLLPATATAQQARDRKVTTAPPRRTGHVLLVEDEITVRQLLKRALEAIGYTVVDAGNGDAAIALADLPETRLDIVITDVIMPITNGRVLVERLRQQRPELPALFISGYPEEQLANVPLDDTSLNGFLAKPFSVVELADVLDRLLGRLAT